MQIGDQIYVRSSSPSLLSDVVHEEIHAIDYLNGVEECVIASWAGETTAYSAERLFQIETGMPVQFINEDDMSFYPVGSVVIVKGNVRKMIVLARCVMTEIQGTLHFFDYAGALYPEGPCHNVK